MTARRIELEWPIAPSGPVTDLVRSVGKHLARGAPPSPFRWRFNVVRDRSANAFSIGGGRVYVNEGTPFACENEAELAAILAHEMGHDLAGHFRGSGKSSNGWLGGLLGSSGPAAPDRVLGSVHQRMDPAKELEADRISIRVLETAGYDPHAALSVAERLSRDAANEHLGGAERLRALRSLLADVPDGGRLDSDAFRRLKRDVEPGTE